MKTLRPRPGIVLIAWGLLLSTVLSCTWSLYLPTGSAQPSAEVPQTTQAPGSTAPASPAPAPASLPLAETTFDVSLPGPLPGGAKLSVVVLDEVTGLPLNPTFYDLQAVDAQHYAGKIALPVGGVIKYRYVYTNGLPVQEDTAFDKLVRYRMLLIPGPSGVTDIVSSWEGQPFSGSTGRAQGQILDAKSGSPLADVLVAMGGQQTFTDSLGNFAVENLPPGTHNMVVYTLDGSFKPFQQGVTIAAGSVTPIAVGLQPAKTVRVTFNVSVPSDTVAGVPLRLAGNLVQLGNTFSDLSGGVNTLATRMPVLTPSGDQRYSITLSLPEGSFIQYKYTMGDGLWNAEHQASGPFLLRELIVPGRDLTVNDAVQTWQAGTSAPILFEVTVPPETPPEDVVSIQFNPYGWTEPLPMWGIGNNQWVYKLFGPFNLVGTFSYRYCRNEQCGSADDAQTPGYITEGRHVSTALTPQDLHDSVSAWQWWPAGQNPQVVATPVTARAAGFMAGIETQKYSNPTFMPLYNNALKNMQGIGANWVVLDPTWTVQGNAPLVFFPSPASDPLWNDVSAEIAGARGLNMSVALFPRVRFADPSLDWNNSPVPDQTYWYDRYRAFILYHADLAARNGAQALILGGADIPAAMFDSPGAEESFRALIGEVRQHFNGTLFWAQPYPGAMQPVPAFLDAVDGIYLMWSAPLAPGGPASVDEMSNEAGRLLDTDVLPFIVSIQKPVIIAIAYASANGAPQGCIPDLSGGCLAPEALSRPLPDVPNVGLDTQAQADLYQAVFQAINARSWISGVTARGYYPPAELQDKSESIHGKPVASEIWYWYPRLLGSVQ